MDVVYAANPVEYGLNGREIVEGSGFRLASVDYHDGLVIDFGHDLRRVRRDDRLVEATPNEANEASLQISVHVYIRLVQNHRVSVR